MSMWLVSYNVIQIYFLVDSLPICSIHYWKWCIEIANYSHCGIKFWICNGKLNLFIFRVRNIPGYFSLICIKDVATSLVGRIFHLGHSLLSIHVCKCKYHDKVNNSNFVVFVHLGLHAYGQKLFSQRDHC